MTAAIILAAGASRRFESQTPKLLAPFRGRPLAAWALTAVDVAGFDEVIVVVGGSGITPLLSTQLTVENYNWEDGIATSLTRGVAEAERRGHEVVVVGLADQPFVPSSAWMAVAATKSPIAVATIGGQRTPPVRLERNVWPLLPTTGDVGARAVMIAHPHLVTEVPCAGSAIDLDTQRDFERWTVDNSSRAGATLDHSVQSRSAEQDG